jgi:hypothetical protein
MSKEIIEIEVYYLQALCEMLKETGDGGYIRYKDGVLKSPGCSNDYGCCSCRFTVDDFIDDIERQLSVRIR